MASILTNSSAMSALATLRSISSNMEATQNAISTGLKVSKASDNAAYWSISTSMRSDNMALSAVTDALGVGAAKVDTAYAGMDSAIEVVKEIKVKIVAAKEEGVDQDVIRERLEKASDALMDEKRLPFFMLINLLGGPGMNSRFNMTLREKCGLVYSIEATYAPFLDTGFLGVFFG